MFVMSGQTPCVGPRQSFHTRACRTVYQPVRYESTLLTVISCGSLHAQSTIPHNLAMRNIVVAVLGLSVLTEEVAGLLHASRGAVVQQHRVHLRAAAFGPPPEGFVWAEEEAAEAEPAAVPLVATTAASSLTAVPASAVTVEMDADAVAATVCRLVEVCRFCRVTERHRDANSARRSHAHAGVRQRGDRGA